MRSSIDKLEMMANQIAAFFGPYPHDAAIAGIGSHIHDFWTPKMIKTLKDVMDSRPNLNALVKESLTDKQQARDRADKADAAPGKVGEVGACDAG